MIEPRACDLPELGVFSVSEGGLEPSAYIVLPLGDVPLNTEALVDEAEG